MSDTFAGPVPANIPIYRSVPPEQRRRTLGSEKENLGTANAMVSVLSYEVLVTTEEGPKNRRLCQITAKVPAKAGKPAVQAEEIFDLDHRAAAPYLNASTIFPKDCNIYTLIVKRPADPKQIRFLK